MANAVKQVLENQSKRKIVKEFKIPKTSLQRQVTKAKQIGENLFTFHPNIGNRRIFSLEEEKHLYDNLKTASKMSYRLSTAQTQELALSVCKNIEQKYYQYMVKQ